MSSGLKKLNIYLRKVSVMVFCALTHQLSAQLLTDDFSDGDFTSSPVWTGNTTEFTINPTGQLQLNAAAEGQSYISSEVGEVLTQDTEWRFFIKQSFSGSDNNNGRIYLFSSAQDVSYTGTSGATVNGYYLQLGESGSSDAIELFRNDINGTKTSIARGTEGFVSSSFEITLKIVRTVSGEWEIWADASAGEEFTLQATGTDASYNEFNYFGWVCKYTTSNADNFFLDHLYVGDPVIDEEPPSLTQVTVNSATELVLLFNEPLEAASAETLTNYSVSNSLGNPSSAVFTAPNQVVLSFATPFISELENTLTVNGVTDVTGNSISGAEQDFTYFEISIPQPGDIIFNEIFADPTPAVGLPEVEWLELYNTSQNAFDLSLLEFYNTNTLNAFESYVLPAGGYVIVSSAAGASALQSFGETTPTSTFSALSNTGDSLTLVYEGTVIDRVVYEDEWYQDEVKSDGGWSLERINPLATCSSSQNWIASTASIGSTPGTQNATYDITPDSTAPEITSASLVNETLVFLQVNEILSEALVLADFSLTGGYVIEQLEITAAQNGILLTLEEPVEVGVPFTISISNLTDCEGNTNTTTQEWEIASGFPAEPGDIRITEIMADPSPEVGLPEMEYVELYNASDLFIDISDADLSGASFATPVIMSPGQYLIITNEDNAAQNPFSTTAAGMVGWSSTFLTNSGKELLLTTGNGIIDVVIYDSSWYQDSEKDDGGWSLEIINLQDPCSDKSNWAASQSALGGTPGEQNSIFSDVPDESAPEITSAYAFLASAVFIEFSEPIEPASLESATFSLNGEEFSSSSVQDDRGIIVNFLNGLSPNEEFTLSVSGVEDCWGNSISSSEVIIGLPEPAEAGDLLINEVLSNPRETGSDYVEIYNHSAKIISLQNWRLATKDDGNVDGEEIISEIPRPLFPGEYALLTESAENVAENYPNAVTQNFIVMDLPSYSNSEGDVVLILPDGEISDAFYYSEDFHFGLLDDTDGVSLERISFNVATQNEDNWSSAAESENYGSPGYKNSQAQAEVGSSGEVTVFPAVFSPGASGDVNNLEISYSFSGIPRSASVVIYSKDGVLLRRLKSNTLIGNEGTFFWDGTDDNGNPVSTGVYVVFMEVFSLNGQVDGYKVPCTVAYR